MILCFDPLPVTLYERVFKVTVVVNWSYRNEKKRELNVKSNTVRCPQKVSYVNR